jgi:hypothetical protein
MQKNIPKIFFFLIMFFSLPNFSQAAPNISSVSGDYTDGSTITVSGSSLGTNAGLNNLEWLGGKNGFIESGTDSAIPSRTNWDFEAEFGDTNPAFQAIKYSSTQAHSGSLSLKSSWPQISQYASGMSYDYGSNISKIYVTWWVNFAHVDAQGQWKMWRLKPNSDLNNADGEIMASSWFYENGDNLQALIMYFCEQNSYDQCFPGSNADLRWIGGDSIIPLNRWVRYEIYAQASSASGVRDGSFVYKMYKQDSPVTTIKNDVGTVITRSANVTNQWRYFHWQNYWGNNTLLNDGTDSVWANYGGRATEVSGTITSDSTGTTRNLLPASPHVNDAYYFLYPSTNFSKLTLNISQAGAGTWNLAWEYWNGSNWATLSGLTDNSNGFHNSGMQKITFTAPADWATKSIADYTPVYYPLRARLSSFTSMTTQPQASDTCAGGCGNEEVVYVDDPYIQIGSEAHVELCDTQTWSARKHCEIQPPTNWSNNSISLTLNKGSFNSGDTTYLYVVDSDGNANSDGQQIILGASQETDTTPPNPPTGVEVI